VLFHVEPSILSRTGRCCDDFSPLALQAAAGKTRGVEFAACGPSSRQARLGRTARRTIRVGLGSIDPRLDRAAGVRTPDFVVSLLHPLVGLDGSTKIK